MRIYSPVYSGAMAKLIIGKQIMLSGVIYTGRDAVLPRLVDLVERHGLKEAGVDLRGAVIFHTAVSAAGVGPTSSNKYDIERAICPLSKAGVRIHLGKGKLSSEVVEGLKRYNSIYAVVPPVSALLESKILERRVVAFPEEGMEALHELRVEEFPCIVAAAHGVTLYE